MCFANQIYLLHLQLQTFILFIYGEMEKKEKKSELEIELEQTIDFLRKRMSEYEFEYNKKLRDIKFLEEENKKLKETIKDHQLYEEKLEHRIIELEELLHWE